MKNMNNMMKQAQKMQSKMLNIQNELADKTVKSTVGGGMVSATANGSQKIVSIEIEKEVVNSDDTEMLQDLIIAAVNDALDRAQKMVSQEMAKITGGIKIPGIM